MEQIEFEVLTDLVPIASTSIETNFEMVKTWLESELEPYATMVVTEDAISEAKKTRANIRKVADGIDAQRKAIKKEWLKPLDDFESQCKQLVNIVNGAVFNLDGQIKSFEEEIRQEKKNKIELIFNEIVCSENVDDFVKFDKIFNLKWLNNSTSISSIKAEIQEYVENTVKDLETICSLNSENEPSLLADYQKTHDIRSAFALDKTLKEIKRREEEKKFSALQDTFREDENASETQNNASEDDSALNPSYQNVIRPLEAPEEPPKPKMYTLKFEVTGSLDDFNALKKLFIARNIQYKKI